MPAVRCINECSSWTLYCDGLLDCDAGSDEGGTVGVKCANHGGRVSEPNNQGQIRVQKIDCASQPLPAPCKSDLIQGGDTGSVRQERAG